MISLTDRGLHMVETISCQLIKTQDVKYEHNTSSSHIIKTLKHSQCY